MHHIQVESPFRLLDEYDVFMDENRRNATLHAIRAHCLRTDQSHRQMIVITPNSLDSVKNANVTNEVRIYKMPDVIRNHAHGLQQQVLDF